MVIFIDDYFNWLTAGAVILPATDAQKASRVKLAYIIDATAAPISDTTIMSPADAQCRHLSHVHTQLPYVMVVAVFSFIAFFAFRVDL